MSEDKKELTALEAVEQHEKLVARIRDEYKPRLKAMSKNQLINMVIELSTHISIFKEYAQENDNDL